MHFMVVSFFVFNLGINVNGLKLSHSLNQVRRVTDDVTDHVINHSPIEMYTTQICTDASDINSQ